MTMIWNICTDMTIAIAQHIMKAYMGIAIVKGKDMLTAMPMGTVACRRFAKLLDAPI